MTAPLVSSVPSLLPAEAAPNSLQVRRLLLLGSQELELEHLSGRRTAENNVEKPQLEDRTSATADADDQVPVPECGFEAPIRNSRVMQHFISELVALYRTLLSSTSSRDWNERSHRALADFLVALPHKPFARDSTHFSLLGSLCVLGGFREPLRRGASVEFRIASSEPQPEPHSAGGGVVIEYYHPGPTASVLSVSELDSVDFLLHPGKYHNEGFGSAADPSSQSDEQDDDDDVDASSSPPRRLVPRDINMQSHTLRAADLVPVSAINVDLHQFPLSSELFLVLRALSQAPSPSSEESDFRPVETSPSSVDDLLEEILAEHCSVCFRSELRWRALSVFESLLAHTSSLDSIPNISLLFCQVGQLLHAHAANCSLANNCERVRWETSCLYDRLWDMYHLTTWPFEIVPFPQTSMAPEPCRSHGRAVNDDLPGPRCSTSLPGAGTEGSGFYEVPSYLDQTKAVQRDDGKMLQYWEKQIIPRIQNYVQGSFKEYEMAYFFESLRQPLRSNDAAAAIDIAFTLCAGHVPEGVTYPDESKDFDVLMIEDVAVGMYALVAPSAALADVFESHEDMRFSIGRAGRVKAVYPPDQLVLLHFTDHLTGLVTEWWYPVETLKQPVPPVNVHSTIDRLSVVPVMISHCLSLESSLAQLIARRALFNLCSSSLSFLYAIAGSSLSAPTAPPNQQTNYGPPRAGPFNQTQHNLVFQHVFLAVSEVLQLSSLSNLGQPVASYEFSSKRLQKHLARFLSLDARHPATQDRRGSLGRLRLPQHDGAVESTAADPPSVSPDVAALLLAHTRSLLEVAAKFTCSGTFTLLLGPGCQGATSPSSSGRPAASSVTRLCVSGASCLVVVFSQSSRLPAGSSLSFFADAECMELIKYIGGTEKDQTPYFHFAPIVIPNSLCWIQIKNPDQASVACQVSPVHPFLGLAFWIMDFMLLQDLILTASSSVTDAESTCYKFCALLLEHYSMATLPPSPLKESLLRMISKFLSAISHLKAHSERDNAFRVGDFLDPVTLPVTSRQLSVGGSANESHSLDILKKMQLEMSTMFTSEGARPVFSLYLQQLLDVMVIADQLRPHEERLCKEFRFRVDPAAEPLGSNAVQETAAEPPKEVSWSCEVCTFENPARNNECEMCSSPKPKPLAPPVRVLSIAPTPSEDMSTAMLHDMSALLEAMRYLTGTGTTGRGDGPHVVEGVSGAPMPTVPLADPAWPAVRPLMEVAWRELQLDRVEDRLFVIENIPIGPTPAIQRILSSALTSAGGADLRLSMHMFIGVDPSKPTVLDEKEEQIAAQQDALLFPWTGASFKSSEPGEDGIIYHLATKGKTQPWCNPHDAGIVTVTAASIHDDSPVSAVVGRTAVRCVSRPEEKQWFSVKFPDDCHILPSHYQLRHYISSKTEALRSWRFEGSNDGVFWDTLREHRNDASLDEKGDLFCFELKDVKQSYRQFRVFMTGLNSNGHWLLALSGFELYGKICRKKMPPRSRPQPPPTNVFAVVELLSNDAEAHKRLVTVLHNLDLDTSVQDELLRPRMTTLGVRRLTDLLRDVSLGCPPSAMLLRYLDNKFVQDTSSLDSTIPPLSPSLDSAVRYMFCRHADITANESMPAISLGSKSLTSLLDYTEKSSVVMSAEGTPSSLLSASSIRDRLVSLLQLWLSRRTVSTPDSSAPPLLALSDFTQFISWLWCIASGRTSKSLKLDQESMCSAGEIVDWLCGWLRGGGFDFNLELLFNPDVAEALAEQEKWTQAMSWELLALLRRLADRLGESNLTKVAASQMRLQHVDMNLYPQLCAANASIVSLRLRFQFLKRINKLFAKLLPLIDLRRTDDPMSIAGTTSRSRAFMFSATKDAFMQQVLDFTAVPSDPPKVSVDRMLVLSLKERGLPFDFISHSVFGRAFRQLHRTDPSLLRPVRPHGTEPFLSFELVFRGEHVVGEGGPWRQFFSGIPQYFVFVRCRTERFCVDRHRSRAPRS